MAAISDLFTRPKNCADCGSLIAIEPRGTVLQCSRSAICKSQSLLHWYGIMRNTLARSPSLTRAAMTQFPFVFRVSSTSGCDAVAHAPASPFPSPFS